MDQSAITPAWAARYTLAKGSPFDSDVAKTAVSDRVRVGDFLLIRLR
jgi:hypothetical protein